MSIFDNIITKLKGGRPPKLTQEQADKARAMKAQGKTNKQIVKELKLPCHPAHITNIVKGRCWK